MSTHPTIAAAPGWVLLSQTLRAPNRGVEQQGSRRTWALRREFRLDRGQPRQRRPGSVQPTRRGLRTLSPSASTPRHTSRLRRTDEEPSRRGLPTVRLDPLQEPDPHYAAGGTQAPTRAYEQCMRGRREVSAFAVYFNDTWTGACLARRRQGADATPLLVLIRVNQRFQVGVPVHTPPQVASHRR